MYHNALMCSLVVNFGPVPVTGRLPQMPGSILGAD